MKRFAVLLGTLLFCGLLSGCAGDPREDAIRGVIQMMGVAASDMDGIKDEVKKAVDKHEKEKVPFDLTEAIKATKKLEETGKKTQEVKTKQVDNAKAADDEAHPDQQHLSSLGPLHPRQGERARERADAVR